MVSFGYVWHELRRRWSRTLVTALGLAAAVGLVMGIVGFTNGVSNAQTRALSPLSSVGTDIVVTRTVGTPSTSSSTTTTTTPGDFGGPGGGGGGGGGVFFGGGANASANASDRTALANNNSSIITDLSKLGPAGTQFTYDFFVNGTLITFPQSAVADVTKIRGVQSAVAGLSLNALHESGTVPQITDTVTTGGQTLQATSQPAPMTAAEESAVQSCLQASGVNFAAVPGGGTSSTGGGTSSTGSPPPAGGGEVRRSIFGGALQKCLPQRFQDYIAQVVVPQQTINRVLNPPQTDTQTKTYAVAGVDPSSPNSGIVTKAQVVSGTWFTAKPADEILVSTAYANTNNIKVGQTLTIDKVGYTVVGLVDPTATGDVSDIYFDLATLQSSSSQPSRINQILVKVDKSSNVNAVAAAIKKELPGADVLTSKQLASSVTGSLSNAAKIGSDLKTVGTVVILAAALVIAALLTLSSIAKRVREIGTLRAIGWSRGRVVSQIMAEMFGIGLVGAALGVLLGLGICGLINAFGPTLTYTVSGVTIGQSSASSLVHTATAAAAAASKTIQVQTSISWLTVVGGIVIAVIGALLAGLAGAWRAARLSPASALRDLG
jgi:ABC-type antimicrobial peptide transport system permease subunit